jgi:hypothetical protein
VPINTWWEDDPAQRYWMQITDREDLNDPLLSPKLPNLTWGYDLVSQVQPGDRVLHWRARTGEPRGLVGWSEVEEHANVIPEYTWKPHQGSQERTTLGWRAVLGQFHAFRPPVMSGELLPILGRIVALDEALRAKHRRPLYFPITEYGSNRPAGQQQVRAAEAYFVKFPVELFDLIPGIRAARIDAPLDPTDTNLPEDFQPPGKKAPAGRTTRAVDPKLRDAVERRSLDVYDIRVAVGGVPRRCEVKGSSMEIDAVELTCNEVMHGNAFTPIDLIVVDNILPTKDPVTGEVTGATGGRRRVWVDWTPAESDLAATKYTYTLPAGAIYLGAGGRFSACEPLGVNELHAGRCRSLVQVRGLCWPHEVHVVRQGCCTFLLYSTRHTSLTSADVLRALLTCGLDLGSFQRFWAGLAHTYV